MLDGGCPLLPSSDRASLRLRRDSFAAHRNRVTSSADGAAPHLPRNERKATRCPVASAQILLVPPLSLSRKFSILSIGNFSSTSKEVNTCTSLRLFRQTGSSKPTVINDVHNRYSGLHLPRWSKGPLPPALTSRLALTVARNSQRVWTKIDISTPSIFARWKTSACQVPKSNAHVPVPTL